MIVTDRKYFIEKRKVEKLDLMCERVYGKKKLQNVIGCDGQEGFGKSTITAGDAYYMAYKLKRPVLLFFDIEKLINHALRNKDHIYIWDDAALAALSMEGYNKTILKFIKTVLLARKNRHTYFINIQEIFRLKEPIVARMIGLTHVYSPDELKIGKFAYYKKDRLINLYKEWQRRKVKAYRKYMTFPGTFPNLLHKIFDEKEYENLKDQAILSIMHDKKTHKDEKLMNLMYKISMLPVETDLNQKEVMKHFEISERTVRFWKKKLDDTDPFNLHTANSTNINNKGYIEPKPIELVEL